MRLGDEDLDEAVHRLPNPGFPKRGAPTGADRARAFDKVNKRTGQRPSRAALKNYNPKKGKYSAIEYSDEKDFIMVLVMGDGKEFSYGKTVPYGKDHEKDPWTEYYGVNVLFFQDGKIDASTADPTSAAQWRKDKDKIIAAAKAGLKGANLPRVYDDIIKEHWLAEGGNLKQQIEDEFPYDDDALAVVNKFDATVAKLAKKFSANEGEVRKILKKHFEDNLGVLVDTRGSHNMSEGLYGNIKKRTFKEFLLAESKKPDHDACVKFVQGWADMNIEDYSHLEEAEEAFWKAVEEEPGRSAEAKKIGLTKSLAYDILYNCADNMGLNDDHDED